MHLSSILIYPIKSTAAIARETSEVLENSLKFDRQWGIFDMDSRIMTGRDYPALLDLQCRINNNTYTIYYKNEFFGTIENSNYKGAPIPLRIHSYKVYGSPVNGAINEKLSNYLGVGIQLYESNQAVKRPVLSKHGGQTGDQLTYGDQAPILILSEESLNDLNTRLEEPVGIERFRPNIVVSNVPAYDEDQWEIIQIGEVKMRVIQQCERCVFTTIDVATKQKHLHAEPLRTLATYRKGPRGGVVLGVHAVPLSEGTITLNSALKILSRIERTVSTN